MLLFLYSAALLTAQHLAVAHPTIKRTDVKNGTLAQDIWINGEQVPRGGFTATAGRCLPSDDVMQCAEKIAESWNVGSSSAPASRSVKVPCTINDPANGHVGACYFNADITVDYSGCKVSDPVIVSKNPLFFCNTACKILIILPSLATVLQRNTNL